MALLVTSVATSFWVEATLSEPEGSFADSAINYGLFVGHIGGRRASQVDMDLSMSCLWSENVCLMSCQTEDTARQEELQDLVTGKGDYACPNVGGHSNSTNSPDKKFINAGIWVSCLLFLAVALLAGVLTAVFAVINTTTNPVEPIAGVFGLYVWNSIAVGSALLVMILWGAHFTDTLSDNVAYSETITGVFKSQGQANLGMSYWLLISVLFLHIANLILLRVRQYLLDREPPPAPIEPDKNTDGAIFLY
ncbi:hypothetical protein Cfor_06577 [Coptotermes formosanus]|uniref:Clarin-1 n=1 Tax=Coptotermes formosanus TaxID=36987 RepID=A0A6L2PE53_COPFO|nr:hypothetical protein Cfor_06577 [Coptotermes formosanus]